MSVGYELSGNTMKLWGKSSAGWQADGAVPVAVWAVVAGII